MKKIKTFNFKLTNLNKELSICDYNAFDETINEWIEDMEVKLIDFKMQIYETCYHNNGGFNEFHVLYTIIYDEDNLKDRFEEVVRENENLKYQIKNMINNQEDRPIESLKLSVRSFNCLKRAGINTNKDLLKRYYDGTLKQDKIRNLGSKCEKEVIKKVESDLLGYGRMFKL